VTDIQFNEEQEFRRSTLVEQKPYFVRLVLSTGIVSTDQQAGYVLLGFSVFLLILAFLVPSLFGGSHPQVPRSIIDATMKAQTNSSH